MSWPAVAWAFGQQAPSSAAKFLLVVLADNSGVGEWLSWPSIPYLVETTQQDRKTVMKNLRALETAGLIGQAGKTGRTGQVTVWRLPVVAANPSLKSHKNGTVGADETVPFFPSNSTVFPSKEYQKRYTEPIKEPIKEPKRRTSRASAFDPTSMELPSWLDRIVWVDWVADRKEKGKPITSRAAAGQLQKLAGYRDEGHDPVVVIKLAIASGWQGLYPPKGSIKPAASPVLHADEVFGAESA